MDTRNWWKNLMINSSFIKAIKSNQNLIFVMLIRWKELWYNSTKKMMVDLESGDDESSLYQRLYMFKFVTCV